MGSTATAALFLLLAAVPAVFAVTFKVGDTSGWTSGIDYTTWVTGKTFRVGDTLEFIYGLSHSVSVVDKAGYDGCVSSGATQNFADGDTKIDLKTVGTMHFLCPTFGHCLGGMKLAVPVLAAASSPATPSSPPSPPSPSSSPPSPPLSPRTPPKTSSPPPSTSPPKTGSPPPSASPPANGTPESDESMTPPPSPLTPTLSPSPPNAASKGVMSYGLIGVTIILMYGVMT
ncbi:PREDICTED: uclacyanin-3-like isoform X1 [Camelina sativa]|uniref:Uclacyanin-3-like isoform X1 n=1 Tax=Camelina sativa TaxID=90675 RepID=A0ABM0SMX8_CAMSA|nr:PREDICTED: uclacyanin-3-like isoform X1 [Camelina sativa]